MKATPIAIFTKRDASTLGVSQPEIVSPITLSWGKLSFLEQSSYLGFSLGTNPNELLVVNFAASRLRMDMDRVPLWRGNHVPIRQLVEDFGRYLYLPRLQTTSVLLNAIRGGLALLT